VSFTDIYWLFLKNADWLTGEEPNFLTRDEKRRLAGHRFEKRRKEWLLGRWAAKSLLLGCNPPWVTGKMDTIQICNETSGAPYAEDIAGDRLPGCLSISHRAGAAFCAYNPGAVRIGADLELVEPKEISVFADYLTSTERQTVENCQPDLRSLAILVGWSGKEAAFKALGTGLRIDTRRLETGGYAWIADHYPVEGKWNDLELSLLCGESSFRGLWMVREQFVFTLAGQGSEPLLVHEI
jgi:4'-phosphopantetheinyl transferase